MEAQTIHYNHSADSGKTLCNQLLIHVRWKTDPNAVTCLTCRSLSKVATESPYSESMSFRPA